MDNCWNMIRRQAYRHTPRIDYKSTWFYNVYGRAVILAYKATGDERMRDVAIGMTQNRTTKSAHPSLNAFCYDQTGDEKYFSSVAPKYARLGGYFPASDAFLWATERPDRRAPAAVKDMKGSGGAGEATLTWTAPGDDGKKGRASVYQVKWSDLPIVELSQTAEQGSFWAAENASGEPHPANGGKKESFVVKGLEPGSYHFALKTRDEVNNESPISNVVKVDVR
jgi:hypothetical protein